MACRRTDQAITRTNSGLLSIGLQGANFSEIRSGIFSQVNAFEILACQHSVFSGVWLHRIPGKL